MVSVHAPPDDEPVDLDSLDSDEEQPAGRYGLAQQIVDASFVAGELALWGLIKRAEVQFEIADGESDAGAWSDFLEFVFENKDFLWLYNPDLDGVEEPDWGRARFVLAGERRRRLRRRSAGVGAPRGRPGWGDHSPMSLISRLSAIVLCSAA
jgi:hypothetical protein